jgi:hypothetical protein
MGLATRQRPSAATVEVVGVRMPDSRRGPHGSLGLARLALSRALALDVAPDQSRSRDHRDDPTGRQIHEVIGC